MGKRGTARVAGEGVAEEKFFSPALFFLLAIDAVCGTICG